jgi:hypothetical protein
VLKRLLSVAVVLASLFGLTTETSSQTLRARVYPFTGEIRLSNPDFADLPINFYEIFYDDVPGLPTGGLNSANGVWLSIDDTYDVSGNGFIDSVNEWIELPGNTKHLAEAQFDDGGILPGQRSISLGEIWNPAIVEADDLTIRFGQPGQVNPTEIAAELSIDGDYDENGTVDELDYQEWKDAFVSASFVDRADGNIDGAVDAADFTIWRDNFGLNLASLNLGAGASGGGNVLGGNVAPEPASGWLVFAAGGGYLMAGARRRMSI